MVTDHMRVSSSVTLTVENSKRHIASGQNTELDNRDRLVIGAAT